MFKEKLGPNLFLRFFYYTLFAVLAAGVLLLIRSVEGKMLFIFILYPLSLLFRIPVQIPLLLGGFSFQPLQAILHASASLLFLWALSFKLSRHMGLAWILKWTKKNEKDYWFLHETFSNSFSWAARNRLLPIIAFDDFTFGAGLSKMSFLACCLGSLAGFLPHITAFSCLGNSMQLLFWEQSIRNWISLLGWLMPCLVLLFSPVFYRHMESWGSEQ